MIDMFARSDGWKIILNWGVFKVENLGVFHFDSASRFERLESSKIMFKSRRQLWEDKLQKFYPIPIDAFGFSF